MKKETVFLREFSELEHLQRSHALRYGLTVDENAPRPFGIFIERLDRLRAVEDARVIRQVDEARERVLLLLRYLYENAVEPRCARDVLHDIGAAPFGEGCG